MNNFGGVHLYYLLLLEVEALGVDTGTVFLRELRNVTRHPTQDNYINI